MPYRKVNWPAPETLMNWYNNGLSTVDIAKKLEVKPNSVWYKLQALGVTPRSITDAKKIKHRSKWEHPELLDEKRLKHLYSEKKLSTFDIAKLVGCSRDSVVRALHEFSIPQRYAVYRSESHKRLVASLKKLIDVEDWQVDFQPSGFRYKIDIAFPDNMVAVEVDGYYHQFNEEHDAKRQRQLENSGWRFLRFEASAVFQDPDKHAKLVFAYVKESTSTQQPKSLG